MSRRSTAIRPIRVKIVFLQTYTHKIMTDNGHFREFTNAENKSKEEDSTEGNTFVVGKQNRNVIVDVYGEDYRFESTTGRQFIEKSRDSTSTMMDPSACPFNHSHLAALIRFGSRQFTHSTVIGSTQHCGTLEVT